MDKKLFREARFERDAIDPERRTVSLAFASEEPVPRHGYREILSCTTRAVRLGRLADGGALLVDHDWTDQVGVVESVEFGADRVGRAVVRFGKSARATEIFNDVVDGIRTKVSFGYWIHKTESRKAADGVQDVTAIDWEPFEVSLVAVPADASPSVGVGRSADDTPPETTVSNEAASAAKDDIMTTENNAPDIRAIENQVRSAELARINSLEQMGEAYSRFGGVELARAAISKGESVGDLQAKILERVKAQPAPSADIGLTQQEARSFSFMRAIHAMANPHDRKAREAAAFEFEVGEAAAKAAGRQAKGLFVPNEVLAQRRDLNVTTSTAGGHVVATDLLASSFIDLLRNRMVIAEAGATMLTGLNGNVAIPRQTGGATAYWVAESGSPTESQQAFDQVTLTPRTVGAFTDISRKLMLQSSLDIEALVRRDLATILALEIDRAALHGSGASNQPTGLASVAGIGSVAGGTNGAAPTWANMISLETEVATDNADVGNLAYVTNAKVRGKLKSTQRVATYGDVFVYGEGDTPINGYRTLISNQVSSALTKGSSSGVCSAIFFGNWADLLVGMWGGLDLTVDPYTGSTSGTVRVVALQDVDVAVRHAESFAAMLDALTV
jgi:HK97 family phage major capsid protein